ncbi:carboxynorspermidine decarboxylase [Citromicrobium sp. RCC1885]|uniref:carboxynorspermidine decarboxylase n=1 Tax=unclassified Citromicrobium TaxID=2630544 RepID=UPI0006C92251|nr:MULTISPECIES: carboxynorspermidine decarboxylase [unclassified Citromicrobium]KPM25209.1 carboxynorspermidine decarboxylase [Citromicrobium sp. RCC1885]KPM28450.1 carboxynorspermidine decarboxylase [Citromicrobium sp. RCC1878]MAO04373.1 carboxynorspermidine decarboxylase [Citromicrobium sp.]OAM10011.1 carboxynorspermidine decarboxylase [Citromicrobium sp. RCC1897]|tara:strand:+ start:1981 stop:3153 length:1173 start_codon:yes stop_codon:yes gene_type:complete
METRAGDPGAFAQFDLSRVDTPAFVVDAAKLRENCRILAEIRDEAEIKMLSALKAFSMWSTAPIIGEYLDGVCTSGLWEARLASEFYDGEISTYCAAYKPEELEEVARLSDHVIFNSPGQMRRAALILEQAKASGGAFDVGLRINPQVPTGEVPRYDPSSPGSRLGFPLSQLTEEHMEGVEGIHFHNLCEQGFEPLHRTWDRVFDAIEPYFGQLKWINMGGGHHITRADYEREELIEFLRDAKDDTGAEIYLEPGEAVALDAGILVGTILDTGENDGPIAITDISATCHMPDVIEAPYRPAMLHEKAGEPPVRLGGPSCLAGDVIGEYSLPVPNEAGQRIAFLDQAHYSMVKTNTFNGVPLPSIWLWDSETDVLECVKRFGYEEFRNRLS